jgi:prophage antirepressor-like protein
MNILESIKHVRPIDGKAFWILPEVFDALGVNRQVTRDAIIDRAKKWLVMNGINPGQIFDLGMGPTDLGCTERGLYAVISEIIYIHGNKQAILAAKEEIGVVTHAPAQALLPVDDYEDVAATLTPTFTPASSAPVTRVGQCVLVPVPEQVEEPTPKNDLMVFDYAGKSVRTVMKDGQPWWVAKDVCEVLGLSDGRKSVNLLDEDERNSVPVIDAMGRSQETLIVNEPGLYSLILRSRKPEAKAFKRWVTHEVLPSIRKTGSYSVAPQPAPALPTDYKSALVALLQEVEKTEAQSAVIRELAPKAAFHDTVHDATGCHTFQEAAKMLGTGRERLFKFCRDNAIVMPKSTQPYQRYIDSGYFKVVENPYNHPKTGQPVLSFTTMITGKGLAWLERKIAASKEAMVESGSEAA